MNTQNIRQGSTGPQRSSAENRPRPVANRAGSLGDHGHGYTTSPSVAEPQNIPITPQYTQEPNRLAPNSRSANSLAPALQYVNQLVAANEIPPIHETLAGCFTWILLAGFVALPGTFENLLAEQAGGQTGLVQDVEIRGIRHLTLLVIACTCSGIGIIGMCWLWYRWQSNYIWVINNVFKPGAYNSVVGVISTLSSVYGTYGAHNFKRGLSGTSRSTLIATGALTFVCGVLFLFYNYVLLRNAKKRHDREYGKRRTGSRGEGYL